MNCDFAMDRKELCMPMSAFLLTTGRLVPGVLNMQLSWLLRNATKNLGNKRIIAGPAREIDKLEAGIWLTIMSWLSTKEMLHCSASCGNLSKLVAPDGPALKFWKGQCNMDYAGIHSMDGVCLHAVASSSVIAQYVERAKHVKVAGMLRFQASQELTAFAAAFDYAVVKCPAMFFATDGTALPAFSPVADKRKLFAAQWAFDSREVACCCQNMRHNIASPVCSKPAKFRWPVCPGKTIDIHVYLLLCMTSDGRLMLAWKTSMSGALEQDFDYAEFLVSGFAIQVNASEDTSMPVAILPYAGNGADGSTPLVGCRRVCSLFRTESSTFQAIRSGQPLTCIVDVALKAAGEQQLIMC